MAVYAVVDLETTGGFARDHGITEIGIVRIEDGHITERFSSLINPHQFIPAEISNLTGISNEMVAGAPDFSLLAERIEALTSGAVFVAHHVEFDYSFLQAAFKSIGGNFDRPLLCTVRYARAMLPGLKRYSLKRLTEFLGIENSNPHRALPDAEAAAGVLLQLLERDLGGVVLKQLTKRRSAALKRPAHLDPGYQQSLPVTPGVYFLRGSRDLPLYIGKAAVLRQRVPQHFQLDWDSGKSQRLLREVRRVETVETGSEELALLLEDHLIRTHWPPLNRAQKHAEVRWGVVHYKDRTGRDRLALNRLQGRSRAVREFYGMASGTAWLYRMVQAYELDPECCGLPAAAFTDLAEPRHAEGVLELLLHVQQWYNPRLLKLPGRTEGEWAWVLHKGEKPLAVGFGSEEGPAGEHWLKLSPSAMSCGLLERLLEEERFPDRPALPHEEPAIFSF